MLSLLPNAVNSIQVGIEDYLSNDRRRPVSAIRNFYAGIFLLGKRCLLNEAPNVQPVEVFGLRFRPKSGTTCRAGTADPCRGH